MTDNINAPKVQLEKSVKAKDEIIKLLRSQGYPTYGRLLDLFDVYLLSGSDDIAYMIPQKATIVLNRKLNKRQVSTLVRHEILHEYLTHMEREGKFHSENPEYSRDPELSNIAADFEISNRGYTEADKYEARNIMLGDKTFSGLVTEDHYEDWVNMTFEQMYKKLQDEKKKDQNALEQLMKQMADLTPENLDDIMDQLGKMQQEAQEAAKESSEEQGQGSGISNKEDDQEGEGSGNSQPGEEESPEQEGSSDKEGNEGTDKLAKQIQQQAGELEKEIEQAKQDIEQAESKGAQEHSAFTPPPMQELAKEIESRAKKIQDMFNDLEEQRRIFDEANAAIRKEQRAQGDKEAERLRGDPLHQFNLHLNSFIKRQTANKRISDYKYFNPLSHRVGGGGFVLAGRGKDPVKFIPKINVYWDVSWSFSDPAKTEAARQAINTLNRYAVKGQIKVNIFYHGDKVSTIKSEVENTGNNGNAVADHISETRPDNVIIITDGDLDWTNHSATVPGAVWMLFYGARSNGLIRNVKGKSDNQYFDIEW